MPDKDINLLIFSTIGVYILIVIGATTSIIGGDVCSTWPLCSPESLESIIALSHRIATLIIGALLLVTFWENRSSSFKVSSSIGLSLVLYPIQIILGSIVAGNESFLISMLHLTIAMSIFSFLLLGLLWKLEKIETDDEVEIKNPVKNRETSKMIDKSSNEISWMEKIKSYIALTKPRLMWLLCLVALASMALAAGPKLDIYTAIATLIGGVLSIGASGTFNHAFERERDQKMERTSNRPLPKQKIPIKNAVIFGIILSICSITVFFIFVNSLAAFLGFLAIVFYSIIYTIILKPNTTQNIVIGGAAGSFPALIGWAAVTGSIQIPAIILAGIIFLWTPAHFYSLALAYKKDYSRADFPMLPVVKGDKIAKRHIVFYLATTLLTAIILGIFSPLNWIYAIITAVFGGIFLREVVLLYIREDRKKAALKSFHASNAYLGALLIAVVLDSLIL